MLNASVARRYARALFEVARDQGTISEIGADLERATGLLNGHRDLRALWEHAEVSARVKLDSVVKAVSAQVSVTVANFLSLLVVKRREKWLADILREYKALGYAATGVVEVEVRSAAPLDPGTVSALEDSLTRRLGARKVVLSTSVDPTLIGGLAVRVGDLLLDGSVKTQLLRMRSRLARGTAV